MVIPSLSMLHDYEMLRGSGNECMGHWGSLTYRINFKGEVILEHGRFADQELHHVLYSNVHALYGQHV